MFQWAFAKAYAKAMGCELQLPDWWGRKIFENANEPMISNLNACLPQTFLDTNPKYPLGYFVGTKDIDLRGFFQHEVFIKHYSRADLRDWFKLKPQYEEYAPILDQPPYSAKHLRRGDYVSHPVYSQHYCVVSEASYDRAVVQFNIPQPVIRVFEGCAETPVELREDGLDWLPDFLVLRGAAHLLRANSSFSVFAGWLGNGKVYSPVVGSLVGEQTVPFVEGNHECTAGVFRNQSPLHLREI